jgi:hypothetical protein
VLLNCLEQLGRGEYCVDLRIWGVANNFPDFTFSFAPKLIYSFSPVKLTTRLAQGPQTGIGPIRVPGYAPFHRLEDTY